ncbi:hypothetical protein DSM104329_02779 [Capillimicrobium parvum]|uniref:DUF6916 domain-containing protein n=2 Tax=Capillimicrobium parvum TaxID=2884022 RepID=A0A9E7C0G0_9ACTN|nr:hypothetical protein DSM104329_02779 [Capillimicrobium parvum]
MDARGLTRRALLALGAGAATAVALRTWPGGAPLAAPRATAVPAHLRRATWTALADRRLATSAGTPLELAAVRDLSPALARRDDAFRLVFRTPAAATGPGFGQGIQRLEHAGIGAFDLFLTPGRRGRRWLTLAATIDRRTGP